MQHSDQFDSGATLGEPPAKKLKRSMATDDYLTAEDKRAKQDVFEQWGSFSNVEVVCELIGDVPPSVDGTIFCVTKEGQTENDIGEWNPDEQLSRIGGDISDQDKLAVADVFKYCALDDMVSDVVETMRVKHEDEHEDGTVVHVRVVMVVDPKRGASEVVVYGRFEEDDM
tara:strand:- start:1477 stop:1986 length:510 start_codon:yes stop_codon:yes gene_type:complete